MPAIDDYLTTLDSETKQVLAHMYALVRKTAPDLSEGVSYGMPAIIAKRDFLSLYPLCSVTRLDLDLSEQFHCR